MNAAEVRRFVAAVQSAAPSSGSSAEFFAAVEREAELLINDHMMFGRAMTRDGRRVPPEEWSRRGPAFASVADLRASGIPSEGSARRAWQLFPWWPDPLSFIGAAANEGRS